MVGVASDFGVEIIGGAAEPSRARTGVTGERRGTMPPMLAAAVCCTEGVHCEKLLCAWSAYCLVPTAARWVHVFTLVL